MDSSPIVYLYERLQPSLNRRADEHNHQCYTAPSSHNSWFSSLVKQNTKVKWRRRRVVPCSQCDEVVFKLPFSFVPSRLCWTVSSCANAARVQLVGAASQPASKASVIEPPAESTARYGVRPNQYLCSGKSTPRLPTKVRNWTHDCTSLVVLSLFSTS